MRLGLIVMAVLGSSFLSTSAFAHGRAAATTGIWVNPADSNQVVVRATFGLLLSADGGQTFQFRCAQAVGFDPASEDPALAWTGNGSLFSGSFSGMTRATADMCAFAPISQLVGRYIIDVQASNAVPSRLFALDSPGDERNSLWRSDDVGETWERLYLAHEHLLVERLRVAPSDETVMYITGAIPTGRIGPDRLVQFLRSTDGGATFTTSNFELEPDERNAHVLAVSATHPNTVYVRIVRRPEDLVGERLLVSDDGGGTWRLLLRLRQISSLALVGEDVFVGSASVGLYRANATVGAFERVVPDIQTVRCLAERRVDGASELWMCSRDVETFAVGKSTDRGSSFTPVWRFRDASSAIGCGCTTGVGSRCAPTLYDYFIDIGRGDDDVAPECDAGVLRGGSNTRPPPPRGGCSIGARSPPSCWPVASLVLVGLMYLRTAHERRWICRRTRRGV